MKKIDLAALSVVSGGGSKGCAPAPAPCPTPAPKPACGSSSDCS